ncbi:MAG: hypothetical protein ACI30Q_07190 [Muribaculaceae bacterium]
MRLSLAQERAFLMASFPVPVKLCLGTSTTFTSASFSPGITYLQTNPAAEQLAATRQCAA